MDIQRISVNIHSTFVKTRRETITFNLSHPLINIFRTRWLSSSPFLNKLTSANTSEPCSDPSFTGGHSASTLFIVCSTFKPLGCSSPRGPHEISCFSDIQSQTWELRGKHRDSIVCFSWKGNSVIYCCSPDNLLCLLYLPLCTLWMFTFMELTCSNEHMLVPYSLNEFDMTLKHLWNVNKHIKNQMN